MSVTFMKFNFEKGKVNHTQTDTNIHKITEPFAKTGEHFNTKQKKAGFPACTVFHYFSAKFSSVAASSKSALSKELYR